MEMMESSVPPGFRFHPTEEELVGYYLKRKVNSLKIDVNVIVDIDLYRMEPWDIQEKCSLGYEEQNEWYFFSHKDRKYPTGTRTNRATTAGFWKATGRDKAVLSKDEIIGMRKTLVFYKGRAPNGQKTDWIMHEYRLQTFEHAPVQEEGWVVCRAFKKPSPTTHRQGFEALMNPCFRPSIPFSDISSSPMHAIPAANQGTYFQQLSVAQEQSLLTNFENQLLEIPQLDSPSSISTSLASKDGGCELNTTANDERLVDNKSCNYYAEDFERLILANSVETLSYGYQNLPILPGEFELAIQSQGNNNHQLGCFSDL